MPIELVRVERVDSTVPPFRIYGTTVEAKPRFVKVHTWCSLKATACQRAMQTGRLVRMTWVDRRFGVCDLKNVSLEDRDDQPAA